MVCFPAGHAHKRRHTLVLDTFALFTFHSGNSQVFVIATEHSYLSLASRHQPQFIPTKLCMEIKGWRDGGAEALTGREADRRRLHVTRIPVRVVDVDGNEACFIYCSHASFHLIHTSKRLFFVY